MLYLFRRILVLALLGIIAFIAGNLIFMYYGNAPKLTILPGKENHASAFSDKLQYLVHLREVTNEIASQPGYVPLAKIPLQLRQAVIAVEDHKFYNHYGVDAEGILRATLVNIQSGGIVEGGSTLTQQLARTLFLSNEQSFRRKLWEMAFAFGLEAKLGKDKILELYLNTVYFGENAYGVNAAAKAYYNKPLGKLSLSELTMLAGILNGPALFNPKTDPSAAAKRQAIVLDAMLKCGFISRQEADEVTVPKCAQ